MARKLILGLDVGTTTVSAALLDPDAGEQVESLTVPHHASLPPAFPGAHEQDPAVLCGCALALTDALTGRYGKLSAVGISCQMHGMTAVDRDGNAVTPLYTWQDERAAGQIDGASTLDLIRDRTGYSLPAGYGAATLVSLLRAGAVLPEGAKICTIGDLLGMKLTGRKTPLVHLSNAAGLGFFDLSAHRYDPDAAKAFGVEAFLPDVTERFAALGETPDGAPVVCAVGDNQAGFLGSVSDPAHTVLANFGTGSQLTALCRGADVQPDGVIELRPLDGDETLVSGSALCGGRAYAMLERFFGLYEGDTRSEGERYERLNALALEGFADPLAVRTTFCGTRADPSLRGMIAQIGEDSFTPASLAAGVLLGMADELYGFYRKMHLAGVTTLAASGNAVRKNPALVEALRRTFGMKVFIPLHTEEAAFGAALAAARTVGLTGPEASARLIRYQGSL